MITIAGAGTPASVTTGDLTREPGYKDYTAAVTEIGKPFDPKLTNSYTNASPMTVYDSLGNSHQVMQYFVKRRRRRGQQRLRGLLFDRRPGHGADHASRRRLGQPTQFTFNKAGMMTSATTVNLTFANPGGAAPANPLNIAINYTGTTQYGSPYAFKGTPDGYTSGEFRGISINPDGSLMAGYTNGQNANVGTIVLADFANLQGLQPVGNNAWKETGASGQPILGQPGNNGLSKVVGQATEASNVDMSKELVNMIIAQRTYQANSQTIKTQNEIMQVLMNIK